MEEKQFNNFWEIKCPKCNSPIDLEIVINKISIKRKLEKKD